MHTKIHIEIFYNSWIGTKKNKEKTLSKMKKYCCTNPTTYSYQVQVKHYLLMARYYKMKLIIWKRYWKNCSHWSKQFYSHLQFITKLFKSMKRRIECIGTILHTNSCNKCIMQIPPRNAYRTYQKDGSNIYGWRLNPDEFIRTWTLKTEVLL